MCRTPKEEKLNRIAKDNSKLIDKIIVYINTELKEELYKNYSNINNNTNTLNILKPFAFYRQIIIRLLNKVEFYSMKERLLMLDIEKGQKLLNYKKSLTVTSVAYGSESSFNKGFKPNTQEKALQEIEEESKRQEKRILKYDLFMKSFEDNKELIKSFIELAPNISAAEITIRHFVYGQRFIDIAKALNYENVYTIWKRAVDELTSILMLSL